MSSAEQIPVVDLKAQYELIRHDVDAAISRVVNNAYFILGSEGVRIRVRVCQLLPSGTCGAS
jgi:hypothetical protein